MDKITEDDFKRYATYESIIDKKDMTIGCDQYVYLFTSSNNIKYILKKPKSESIKISNEVFALNIIKSCTNITIPIPVILYHDNDLLIETFLEGNYFMENDECSKELGCYIKQLHSIALKGFGKITPEGIGECLTERDYLPYCIDQYDPSFKSNKYMKELDIPRIIEDNIDLLDSERTVLLHGDLQSQNILTCNGKVSGIIDFADVTAGAPEYDLAFYYVNVENIKTWNSFVEGYGEDYNKRKMFFYVFILGTWLLSSDSKMNEIRYRNFKYSIEYLESMKNKC